eukprot:NODE_8_length_66115_cov_0.981823.p9 type:complete len:583 gc:universal NODE_8_length_66115_cov_0.981823:37763-36015(-)
MDIYLAAYEYYLKRGRVKLLSMFLELCVLVFIMACSTFLISCIDYKHLLHLDDKSILIEQCWYKIPVIWLMFLWSFFIFFILQVIQFLQNIPTTLRMHDFYNDYLNIPDEDLSTVSWDFVAKKIIHVVNNHAEFAAKDQTEDFLVQSIMKKENFMIALFNHMDPSMKVGNMSIFGLSLEWNLTACILGLLGNNAFLHQSEDQLTEKLKKRFKAMAVINGILLPLIAVFLLMYIFFRYAEEIKRSPGTVLSRQYSRYSKYLLRQYNELPHLFQQRLNNSFEHAVEYVSQFPNEFTIALARFFAFVCSALLTIILFLAFLNQEFLTHVIIYDQTPLFYIGLLGSLIAITRNMIPAEHISFSPDQHILKVVENIQYCPKRWNNQLHTKKTFREFCTLFPLKFEVLFHEILSLLATPYILWTTFHDKSEEIIDFLRNIAIDHQDLGIVCKFACFEMSEAEQDNKMVASMLNFKKDYPQWELDEEHLKAENNDKVLSLLKQSIHLEVPKHSKVFQPSPENKGKEQKPYQKPNPNPISRRSITDPLLINETLDLPFAQIQAQYKTPVRRDIQKPFNLSESEVKNPAKR